MLKLIKRALRKRNNAGFTLVEVIVASALLGVLLLGVIGFTQPVLESVREKEQNARAVMLCETVENYIFNSTKYAYYVQTFSGVTAADVVSTTPSGDAPIVSAAYTGTEFPDRTNASLAEMKQRLNELGPSNYEIRCIGMRWLDDPKTGEKKLMLTNEVVDQSTCALDLSKSVKVFDPCFYEGLYPVMEFRNYNNQHQVVEPITGNLVDKYADADLKIAAGIDCTMKVYLDPLCYSVTEAARDVAGLTFVGTTFLDFHNISSNKMNKNGLNKVSPNVEVSTYDVAKASSPTLVYTHEEYGDCYYPDTYIYYLVLKNTVTTGAPPATP